MKCPYCGKQAKISDIAKMNMESYGRSVRARTECCKKVIIVFPEVIFRAIEPEYELEKDDWGN